MNAAKQLALAAEALHACGFRGRANKLRRVADELALTEAAFDGIHAQLAAVAAERDALAAEVERVRALASGMGVPRPGADTDRDSALTRMKLRSAGHRILRALDGGES